MDIASYDAVKARQILFSVPSMDEAMKLAVYRIPKNTQLVTQHALKRFLTFLEAALKGSQQEFSPDLLVNSPEVLAPNFGFILFSRFFFPSPPFWLSHYLEEDILPEFNLTMKFEPVSIFESPINEFLEPWLVFFL